MKTETVLEVMPGRLENGTRAPIRGTRIRPLPAIPIVPRPCRGVARLAPRDDTGDDFDLPRRNFGGQGADAELLD